MQQPYYNIRTIIYLVSVISFEFSELPLLCHIFRIQYTIFLQIDIR